MKFDKSEEEKAEQEAAEQLLASLLASGGRSSEEVRLRVAALYGDITQEKCSDAIYNLLYLKESGKATMPDPNGSKTVYVSYEPVDFYISTWGGSVVDMFAVYDVMKMMQRECNVCTFGFGKVMSAGVVLLAGGTKGERYIGANCRLMIHGVSSGQQGNIDELKNELAEAKWAQKQYIQALAKDSKMSQKQIRDLFAKNTNIYFSAKQAIEYGIADHII
jgi:ATP-dependent Clp protease protease subunit